jgi:hypothetical protein
MEEIGLSIWAKQRGGAFPDRVKLSLEERRTGIQKTSEVIYTHDTTCIRPQLIIQTSDCSTMV